MEENFVARQFPIGSVSKDDQKHALFQLRLAIIYAEYIICSLASFSRGTRSNATHQAVYPRVY